MTCHDRRGRTWRSNALRRAERYCRDQGIASVKRASGSPPRSWLHPARLLFVPTDFCTDTDLCDDPIARLASDDIFDLWSNVLVAGRYEKVRRFDSDRFVLSYRKLHRQSAPLVGALANPLRYLLPSVQHPLCLDMLVVSAKEDLIPCAAGSVELACVARLSRQADDVNAAGGRARTGLQDRAELLGGEAAVGFDLSVSRMSSSTFLLSRRAPDQESTRHDLNRPRQARSRVASCRP